MQEFNNTGVLFAISDYIGKKNIWEAYPIQRKHYHANEEQINEMTEHGFEIGSHSKTHKYLPYLKKEDILSELNVSKQYLEETFKTEIISCCYPYGGYSKKVLSVSKSAGYIYGMGNRWNGLRYTFQN